MNRDRISGECVDGEYVESLRRLSLKRQSCVSHDNVDFRWRVPQIRKFLVGEMDVQRIDLVKPVMIAWLPVRCNCAGAKSDHRHLQCILSMSCSQRDADSRVLSVIRGRPAPAAR